MLLDIYIYVNIYIYIFTHICDDIGSYGSSILTFGETLVLVYNVNASFYMSSVQVQISP